MSHPASTMARPRAAQGPPALLIVAHIGARRWGGAERAICLLLAGLQRRGHAVLLLCNADEVARAAAELGIPTERLRLGGDHSLHHAVRLALRLRRLRPEAFLVGTFRKSWLAALGARLAGIRPVVSRIGLESDTPRRAKYRFVFNHWIDLVVLNASRIRPAYDALPGLPASRVVVIPNGIPPRTATTSREEARARLRLPPSARVVGTVARLVEQKRLDRLLDAVSLLPADVHCLVAGEGEARPRLAERAERLGLASRVHFLGWLADPGAVLDALDVYILSSDREGMSSSMLEALAAGVPVVSTPVSGTEEALEPGPSGAAPGLVVDFDAAAIAAAVRTLLDDPPLRAEMAAAARERARSRFSYEGMVEAYERAILAARDRLV